MVKIIEHPVRLLVTGTDRELATLKNRLRYRPKDYWRSDAYQLWKITGGERGWDGYHYPLVLKTPSAGETLRGHKDTIVQLCQEENIEIDLERALTSPFASITIEEVTDDLIQAAFTLDLNQKTAILEWLKHGMGIANMAVNAGKTATYAAAAALIKKKFPDARILYFTFTERLVTQVHGELNKFLPGWHITQYGGGGKRDKSGKDIVVATMAILNRNFRDLQREKFFTSFHAIFMDESHHCQAPTAENIIRACSAYFRFAASDTLKEGDPVKFNRIRGFCGPVRCTVTSSQLIEAGRSAAPQLYMVDVPEWKGKFRHLEHEAVPGSIAWTLVNNVWTRATYLGPVYQVDAKGKVKTKTRRVLKDEHWINETVKLTIPTVHRLRMEDGEEVEAPASLTLLDRRYDKAIIRFKERNEMIKAWAQYYHSKKWRTVVVATRTPHVITLETILNEAMPGFVRSLYGKAGSSERNQAFTWLKRTPGAVLVTPLIKEGVSINEIKAGIIADPIADWEFGKQVIGRFMRQKEDNVCYITWFIDRQHRSYLKNTAELMDRLDKIEGFTFYHPVTTPDTIATALVHKGHL